ncbi:ORM1-like protein 3, partial [Tanacetum coccineum]
MVLPMNTGAEGVETAKKFSRKSESKHGVVYISRRMATYILILFFAWLVVLSVFGCSPGMAWTTVNLVHAM